MTNRSTEREHFSFPVTAMAVLCAAASTSTAIPALRKLSEALSVSEAAAGLLVPAHAFGVVLGGALLGMALARSRPDAGVAARSMAVTALSVSAVANALMVTGLGYGALLLLRCVDGIAHVAALMCLMGAGAAGDDRGRARRMTWLGALLVVGVGAGIGLGAVSVRAGATAAFGVSAGLATLAALAAGIGLPSRVTRTQRDRARTGAALDPRGALAGLVVMCERFAMGVLSVGLPFAVTGGAGMVGRILALFLITSVLTIPLAPRLVGRVGTRNAMLTSSAALAVVLITCIWPIALSLPVAYLWAIAGGGAAGLMFMSGLLLAAELADNTQRIRTMGLVHAGGSGGYLVGATAATGALAWSAAGMTAGHSIALLGGGAALLVVAAAAASTTARNLGTQPR